VSESDHDHMPIGAGLVLIALAGFQWYRNNDLHNNLLTAAAVHNAIDGAIPFIGVFSDRLSAALKRHWSRNIDPGGAILIYVLMVVVIGGAVLRGSAGRLTWGLVQVEAIDSAINLGVRWWVRRHSRSAAAKAISWHLLLDVLIAPLVIGGSAIDKLTGETLLSQVVAWVIVLAVAYIATTEIREVIPELHLHREEACPPDSGSP
jgi:divalent metal cation (Fe/Co/Zn/Cd) transporter